VRAAGGGDVPRLAGDDPCAPGSHALNMRHGDALDLTSLASGAS
jgi:hypothetical protein